MLPTQLHQDRVLINRKGYNKIILMVIMVKRHHTLVITWQILFIHYPIPLSNIWYKNGQYNFIPQGLVVKLEKKNEHMAIELWWNVEWDQFCKVNFKKLYGNKEIWFLRHMSRCIKDEQACCRQWEEKSISLGKECTGANIEGKVDYFSRRKMPVNGSDRTSRCRGMRDRTWEVEMYSTVVGLVTLIRAGVFYPYGKLAEWCFTKTLK